MRTLSAVLVVGMLGMLPTGVVPQWSLAQDLTEANRLNQEARKFHQQGRYADAQALFQRLISLIEESLGPSHPRLAPPLNNLAQVYSDQARYSEAAPLLERALKINEHALGPRAPQCCGHLKQSRIAPPPAGSP